MDFEAVKAWLEMRNQQLARRYRNYGIVGMVLFPIGLLAGFVGVFLLVMLIGFRTTRSAHIGTCIWIALGCLPLMFLFNRLLTVKDPMERYMEEGVGHSYMERKAAGYEMMGVIICWIAFAGPRLLDWSLTSYRDSKHLLQQDTHSCAAVLWVLMSRLKKVPIAEFATVVDWLDLDAALPEVRKIPGFLVLKGPPEALALSDDLRTAIRSGKSPD